jgi:hypothetical protein
MEKINYHYNFTSNTRTAFTFLPDILKEISGDHIISLKRDWTKNEWIASGTDEFNENLKYDFSDENEFINGRNFGFSFKFKIEDDHKIISFIEFSRIWGFLQLNILYDKEFNYEEWEIKFSERLALEKASYDDIEEDYSSLPSINKKIVTINRKLDEMLKQKKNVKKVFVSMRFDEHSKRVAFELNRFLSLLNLEMITGMGVEPRSISEKVKERIGTDIDLFLILLTKSGSSDWINQEIGYAKGKDLHLLVLKEKNVDKTIAGMLADNERIEFTKISETFIGILEAIQYLENSKAAPLKLHDLFY